MIIGGIRIRKAEPQCRGGIVNPGSGTTTYRRRSRSLVQDSEILANREEVLQSQQFQSAPTNEGRNTHLSTKKRSSPKASEIQKWIGSEAFPSLMDVPNRQLGTEHIRGTEPRNQSDAQGSGSLPNKKNMFTTCLWRAFAGFAWAAKIHATKAL